VSTLLAVREVTKVYRTEMVEVQALRGISFDVAGGEFIAVMGPSGCGKTTLLDVLGALSRPTSGTYEIAGRRVDELDDTALARLRNRDIGFVFQTFNLLPRATVLQNVELPLVYAGVAPAERRRRASAILERVGLHERLHHHPNELSGGQMQRAAIARAVVTEPLLILADEPTGNLDSAASGDVMHLLAELHAHGNTIVLVTHDRGVAAHATRALHLRDGRLVEDRADAG